MHSLNKKTPIFTHQPVDHQMNLHNFACKEHPLVCLGSNPKSLFLPTKGNDWLRKKQCWHCWYRVIPIQPTLEQGPLFQCCFMQTWEHRFYFPLLVKRSPGKENLTFKWDSEALQTILKKNKTIKKLKKTLVLVILADWSMEGKSFHQTNNLTNIWNCRGSGEFKMLKRNIYILREGLLWDTRFSKLVICLLLLWVT